MTSPFVIFLRGILGMCPNCGKSRMFNGIYSLHDRCPSCGLRFENLPGDFTGAAYINTVATGGIAVVLGMLAVLYSDISIFLIMIIGTPLVLLLATLLHQPIKGGWIALMYYTEAIQPPEDGQ